MPDSRDRLLDNGAFIQLRKFGNTPRTCINHESALRRFEVAHELKFVTRSRSTARSRLPARTVSVTLTGKQNATYYSTSQSQLLLELHSAHSIQTLICIGKQAFKKQTKKPNVVRQLTINMQQRKVGYMEEQNCQNKKIK